MSNTCLHKGSAKEKNYTMLKMYLCTVVQFTSSAMTFPKRKKDAFLLLFVRLPRIHANLAVLHKLVTLSQYEHLGSQEMDGVRGDGYLLNDII
jgi:hypothetical protein